MGIAIFILAWLVPRNIHEPLETINQNQKPKLASKLIRMGLNHDLVKAVKKGNLTTIKELLKKGAELNTTVSDSLKKRTLLHHASQKGHEEIVLFLIKQGISPNVVDDTGKTPLYYAAEERQYGAAKILIENNATVNIKGDWNPLSRAAETSFYGTEIVQLLIENGADVNMVVGGTGHTVLSNALRQVKIEASKILIENGANVNHTNLNGETPIMEIAYFDRLEHLKLLLDNHATIKGKNHYNGNEILHNAAFGGFPEMINFLIKHKAPVNPLNNEGKTPLHIAVERGKIKAVKVLLEAGADRNIKDKKGNTPINLVSKLNEKKEKSILKLFDKIK